ncbi:MAG: hypothetical protein GQ564_13110 [Bacteroidales bacterium]|nr:hypothetical protein [Bacteroidales bacterium]
MDIRIGMFLKLGSYENIRDLYENGTVYLNTIQYFRNLEDNELRGDNYEDSTRIVNSLPRTFAIPEIDKEFKKEKNTQINISYPNVSFMSDNVNQFNKKNKRKVKSIIITFVMGVIIAVTAGLILDYIQKENKEPEITTENDNSENTIIFSRKAPIVVFNNGKKGEVEYSISLLIIDTLIVKSYQVFGEPEKAQNYLLNRIRNEIIKEMERVSLEYARKKRDEIEDKILRSTYKDQIRCGYSIISLNINEIKTSG